MTYAIQDSCLLFALRKMFFIKANLPTITIKTKNRP